MCTKVSEVMTSAPVAVAPDTGYKRIATVLARHRISAVPVVDDAGAPIGVVSEADLLARLRRPRPARLAGHHTRDELRKANALLAEDLMTTPVVTIDAGESVGTAATRLGKKGVRRLFVVEDGKLTGVVSRRDLLATFRRSDEEIREEIEHDVLAGTLRVTPGQASVTVEDGVVTLLGRLDNHGAVDRAGALANEVSGVVEVRNRLDFVWDDDRLRPAALGL
ncbi:CBS domain-containing protein [Amycolatopsis orientalis]|uniref:CBS domain-containing protein n=1 Tax=Amycolatopsis orientalis TaxID=31958 RepID=UPI0003F6445F|nr:CBS domain-containing protein [Amycolatopsis orientalis]